MKISEPHSVTFARQKIYNIRSQEHVANEILLRQVDNYSLDDFRRDPELFVHLLKYLTLGMGKAISELSEENPSTVQFINFTASQILYPNFNEYLDDSIKRYKCDPRRIIVEITESIAHEYPELIRQQLAHNKNKLMIAIDDFGSGYSNFYQLIKIEPEVVKLDMSLLHAAGEEKKAEKTFYALVNMFKNLDYRVVAEGIENQSQFRIARNSDADFGQGYFLHKPETMKEIVSDKPLEVSNVRILRAHQTQGVFQKHKYQIS